jgi:hypothetical protein
MIASVFSVAVERSNESRTELDEIWRQVRASTARPRSTKSFSWLLRHIVTIGLVHIAVLGTVYFLLLVGDALFTSYAIVMRDAVFVSYVAQLGWLQRMASDIKAAIAFIVGLSALLQSLFFLWRVAFD